MRGFPRILDLSIGKRFLIKLFDVWAILMADLLSILPDLLLEKPSKTLFHTVISLPQPPIKPSDGPSLSHNYVERTVLTAMAKAVFPGVSGWPHDHTTLAKAIAFWEALEPSFREYARQVIDNSIAMSDKFMENGLRVISWGTENHIILLDVFLIALNFWKKLKSPLRKSVYHAIKIWYHMINESPWPFRNQTWDTSDYYQMNEGGCRKQVANFIWYKALRITIMMMNLLCIKQEVKKLCETLSTSIIYPRWTLGSIPGDGGMNSSEWPSERSENTKESSRRARTTKGTKRRKKQKR